MAAEAQLAHSIATVGPSLSREIASVTALFGQPQGVRVSGVSLLERGLQRLSLHSSTSRPFIPRASDAGVSLEASAESQESAESGEALDEEWPQLRAISVGLVQDTVAMLDTKCDSGETKVVRLLLALGLGKQQVAQAVSSYPDLLQLSVVDILARLRVLLDLGSSLGEVASSLVREPRWLHAPVQRMYDMVEYLESLGVARDKVHRVLLRFPRIMELSEADITPSLARLQYIVGAGRDIYRMIERQPRVLGLSQAQIAETVDVLKAHIAPEQVADVLLKKPLVLLMSRDAIVQRIRYLASIFHKHRLSNVFKVAPGLLTIDTARLKRQYARLEAYLDPAATEKLVNAFPQALTLSWEKVLLPKFQFLEELGLDRFEVLNFPAYLGYSLDSRIRPRCAVLLAAGYQIRAHDEVITTDNERRLRKFGRSHHEILQTFGAHSVCIQHIVGLTDADFHSQFGVNGGTSASNAGS
ncbi:hypothetical protein CLOM_g20147 [Closterium sp. NIES-68]|nr:hypothetical protein CLOM_g20147 [Closterium sp. NIES-68]GJP68124.1 hypothetical protein CLOP_g24867 [Closterium sp. NIES-67]